MLWQRSLPLILSLALLEAHAYTNLDDAYSAIGFNPNAPGNAVVVLFSDPHMTLDPGRGITTNLDYRLVNSINAMTPPPARILVSGDICTTYSPLPGYLPSGGTYLDWGTNE